MYDWLAQNFGESTATAIYYGIAGVAALVVLWVLWYWTRRMAGGMRIGHRGRQPRLAILEAAALDNHRRIVLIRRDDVQHLVMIGGQNDFVIESGIGETKQKHRDIETFEPAPAAAPTPAAPPAREPAPRPAAEEPRKPTFQSPPATAKPAQPVEWREPATPAAPAVEYPVRDTEAREPAPVTPPSVERPRVEQEIEEPRVEPAPSPHAEPVHHRDEHIEPEMPADDQRKRQPAGLENEMEKLLSELTNQRK